VTGRRIATITALALATMAGASGVATADVQVTATVMPAATTDSTNLSTLESSCTPPVNDVQLELYGSGGTLGPGTTIGEGWTLATVLGCLATPIPLSSVTGVTIAGPDGPQVGPDSLLTPADLATPSDFANPQESPLIGSDGDGLEYERPWRGSGDDNAADAFQLTSPATFSFEVFTGPALAVSLTAPSAAAVDAAATLSASVAGAPSGLSYSWSFDGGSGTATGASTSVTFGAPGSYKVTVEVTDAAGGVGVATSTIAVGAATAPTSTGPTSGPASSTGTTPGAPPSHKRRHKPAHRRHRTTVTQPAVPTPATTPTTSTPARPIRASAPATPALATLKPATPTRAHATAGAPSTTSSPPTAAPSPAPPRVEVRARIRTQRPHRRPTPAKASAGSTRASRRAARVEGRLIADVTPLPAVDSAFVRRLEQAGTAPSIRRASSPSALPALAGALGLVLLFALGVARELRWRVLRSAP
jgi:hypothetical protein